MKAKSNQAMVAEAIRKEIKAKFPKIKCKCRMVSYESVRVELPKLGDDVKNKIEEIAGKYKKGEGRFFNSYNYNNLDETIPQVMWIFIDENLAV